VQHSQVVSTSQRFAPPKPVTALFHAAGAHGVFPFRAFPLLESVHLPMPAPLLTLPQLSNSASHGKPCSAFAFPLQPPSGVYPSSKSVHTMPGVNPNHRSRCSPGFAPLQGSPRPRDGHAFTLPPLTHLGSALVLRRVPRLRPMPQSFTHAACGLSPEGDCRPSWGSFPCHT
jgi:hypothetical protein